MARWVFEPGHTAAEFRARHMMVTWVRGHFKDIHGTLDADLESPPSATVEATIDARGLWTGEAARDEAEHAKGPFVSLSDQDGEGVSADLASRFDEYCLCGNLALLVERFKLGGDGFCLCRIIRRE